MMNPHTRKTIVVMSLLVASTLLGSPYLAEAMPAPIRDAATLSPHDMVARYFADIKSHHYYQAHALEATCTVQWVVQNPPGARPGSASLTATGNGPASTYAGSLAPVRSFGIQSIRQFHHPLLTRLHFLGFWVRGWFTFVYRPVSAGNPGENEHASGYHRIGIIVRRCDGRWEVDPNWLETGGSPAMAWR